MKPILTFATFALFLLLGGCGARTGPRVPDFIDRRPTPPPQCFTQPATITIVPTVTLDNDPPLPAGRSAMRFVDWTIRNTCAPQSPPNPPNSSRIGPRRSFSCNVLNGTSGLAMERRVTGDCAGTPGGSTPETFQVDDTVPGQSGTSVRQIVAMRVTGGNVCISGSITYRDGSSQDLPPSMWRVTVSGAPTMGYVVRADPTAPGRTAVSPVGLVMPGCPAV